MNFSAANSTGYIEPASLRSTYVLFIKQTGPRDFSTWLHVAKCLKIWDLDARGYHGALWRFFLNGHHLLVMGVPYSPYAHLMPKGVTPLSVDAAGGVGEGGQSGS